MVESVRQVVVMLYVFIINTYYINMIHVGNRIKEVLEEQGHNACWLAQQIPCERSNVYNIFKRESIGIDLLFRISEVLGHDFFKEISEEVSRELESGAGK